MPRTTLITGGAGFIGSHLADAFLAEGDRVVVLDNLATGRRAYVPPAAEFVELDLLDAAGVDALLARVRPEVILHHAGQINVRKSLASPTGDAATNILGSLILFEAAARAGVKQLVFSSTGGAMYGDAAPRPTPESAPAAPESPYGIAKATVEAYFNVLGPLHDLTLTIFRYANIYGPRQIVEGEAGVVAIFAQELLANRPPTIYGSGDFTRDYLHVADVVRANQLVVAANVGGLFNLGTGHATSVLELFHLIQATAGGPATPAFAPERAGEIHHSQLDASRFRTAFDWAPAMDLVQGLAETVAWFRSGASR